MQPSRALWRSQADLMAADTTILAAATANHVHLSKKNFTPNLDNVLADFDEATFTGSGPLNLGTGAQPVYYDGVSGLLTILLKSPAGGLHWICTVDPGTPETIYGIFITDTADAVYIACYKLDVPVTISEAGQGLSIPDQALAFNSAFPQ